MSEVIAGVVKFAFGLISNKLRTYGAEKLDDGGLTDQKMRGMIVREFDEIKSKLAAISRKDLLTSISSLQEGIVSLIMSYGESFESDNPSTSKIPSAKAGTVDSKPSLSSVTAEDATALANVTGKMKIESNSRLESEKKSFEEAGEKASKAFHNTALSINERILAAKVRIASHILQHMDNLEFAVSKCLHCLRELNDMRAIQKVFSVDLKGGMKSVFKKDSRREIVENVVMVNWVFADFISNFTKQRMAVFDWPMIQCGKLFVHPIHYSQKKLPHLKEMKITPPWDGVVADHEREPRSILYNAICVLNKKGDLICFTKDRPDLQKLDNTTGKLQPYSLSSVDNTTKCPQFSEVIGLAIDEDDTLYVLSGDEMDGYALSVYSADGKNTHHCTLNFLNRQKFFGLRISVNNDKNIVIGGVRHWRIMIYLLNSHGELINSFDTSPNDNNFFKFVFGSWNKEIILLTEKLPKFLKHSNVLHMYTEDGQLQKTVKFRPSDNNNTYHSLCYNQVTKNIIGCVRYIDNDTNVWDCYDCSTFIEQLSGQTAGLQHSYLLYHTNFPGRSYFHLVCHPSGTLALVGAFHLIFLKKPSQ